MQSESAAGQSGGGKIRRSGLRRNLLSSRLRSAAQSPGEPGRVSAGSFHARGADATPLAGAGPRTRAETIMGLPLLHLPVVQNWDCHVCGTCCKEYRVRITDEERKRIEAQG